jgi:hypothetical protein
VFSRAGQACIVAEKAVRLPGRKSYGRHFPHPTGGCQPGAATPAGGVVLLDIAKALDITDRPFLFSIMSRCGGGHGMRQWVRLMLGHTPAAVVARGGAAKPLAWHAVIRKG